MLAGREEYKRIIDATAAIGCDHLTFAPQNTGISARDQSVDTWKWEYVLWLSLGQKIRNGEWRVDRDPVPDSIQQMLDYARSKNVKLHGLRLSRPGVQPEPRRGSRRMASMPRSRYRSLQDWLIETMVAFQRKTDLGGFFFDYVYLSFPGTSRYAQWFGWRRVQEALRRAAPGIVISGGAYHGFYGPWTHLAGNWPWPMFGDEQPESHVNFQDLHFARVEADRMRYTTFLYKNYEYYPTEALPGFISHQVPGMGDTNRKSRRRQDRLENPQLRLPGVEVLGDLLDWLRGDQSRDSDAAGARHRGIPALFSGGPGVVKEVAGLDGRQH